MEKFAAYVSKCANFLEQVVKVVATILLAFLVSIVLFQVFSRVLFGKSYPEIEELSIVTASWCAFFAVAYTVRRRAHVRIELFFNKLPVKMRHVLMILINSTIFVVLISLLRYGFLLARRKMDAPMTVLPFKSGIWYMSLPVGMIFATLFMFESILTELVELKKSNNV